MTDHSHNEAPQQGGLSSHGSEDIQVAGIVWFIVVLTVSVVFLGWLMVGLLTLLEGRETKAELDTRPSPFAAQRKKLPPEPRLQLAPNTDEQIEKHEPPDLQTQPPLEEIKQ